MKNRFLTAAIAVVAICLAAALVLYFDPFSGLTDIEFEGDREESASDGSFSLYYDNVTEKLPEKAEKLLKSYFTCFYSSVKTGTADAVKEFFSADNRDYLVDGVAVQAAKAFESACGTDLSFSEYKIKVHCISCASTETGYLAVRLTQSVGLFYDFAADGASSDSGVITHDFVLKLNSGSWKIYSHDADGGLWQYAKGLFADCSGTEALDSGILSAYYKEACELAQEQAQSFSQCIKSSSGAPLCEASVPYDREAAVSYAMQWAAGDREVRNLNRYDSYDNDSANFVSQCLAAGGMSPDLSGSDNKSLWKWYDAQQDYTGEAAGCTRSWYECDAFYRYCTMNISSGIAAVPDVMPSLLEKGDIVQFLESDPVTGEISALWQGIITQVIADETGAAVDYLITAHSPELLNVPLSSLPAEQIRFIKIVGGQ